MLQLRGGIGNQIPLPAGGETCLSPLLPEGPCLHRQLTGTSGPGPPFMTMVAEVGSCLETLLITLKSQLKTKQHGGLLSEKSIYFVCTYEGVRSNNPRRRNEGW